MEDNKQSRQTKLNGEDIKLVIYRLGIVEAAVKDLGAKLDKQDTIKRADLVEFRDVIVTRITEVRADLQKQIDTLDREKANSQELHDFKKQLAAYGVFISALAIALFSYLLTRIK